MIQFPMSKILISLYWVVLLLHNWRQRKQGGLVPYLLLVNSLVILALMIE